METVEKGLKAVFLDKDGTLLEDVPYNTDPANMRLLPGVTEGLALLHTCGYRLIVVSNQSGVARGYFREDDLRPVECHLRDMLAQHGIPLVGFYYCPHHPCARLQEYRVRCDCRKPQPGLLLRAACDHGIDLRRSWLVGDILNDIEAGRRAGCRTVLIDNGNETEWQLTPQRVPHHVVSNMVQAALVIVTLGVLGASREISCLTAA
jgi:D,D-heptose 1,7-bisphosphate phosphatase